MVNDWAIALVNYWVDEHNVKVVSEPLGHSPVSVTLDTYSHVLPDMQEEATQKLEDALALGAVAPA